VATVQEHEYAIRRLTELCESLLQQVEKNANAVRQNREDILVIKTKWGMVGVVAGVISALIVKMMPFHL